MKVIKGTSGRNCLAQAVRYLRGILGSKATYRVLKGPIEQVQAGDIHPQKVLHILGPFLGLSVAYLGSAMYMNDFSLGLAEDPIRVTQTYLLKFL